MQAAVIVHHQQALYFILLQHFNSFDRERLGLVSFYRFVVMTSPTVGFMRIDCHVPAPF